MDEMEVRLLDEKLARLREVVDTRFDAKMRERDLAYADLNRRLEVLNHMREETVRDRDQFLPRASFEQFFKDFGNWRDTVNAKMNNMDGRIAAYAGIIGFVAVLMQVFLHYWR